MAASKQLPHSAASVEAKGRQGAGSPQLSCTLASTKQPDLRQRSKATWRARLHCRPSAGLHPAQLCHAWDRSRDLLASTHLVMLSIFSSSRAALASLPCILLPPSLLLVQSLPFSSHLINKCPACRLGRLTRRPAACPCICQAWLSHTQQASAPLASAAAAGRSLISSVRRAGGSAQASLLASGSTWAL